MIYVEVEPLSLLRLQVCDDEVHLSGPLLHLFLVARPVLRKYYPFRSGFRLKPISNQEQHELEAV